MPSISSLFKRPLLIYDDKCYSCAKFANLASVLSRGWIRIAGHHYSEEANEAKRMIFPQGYDPTKMFWLINRTGAHGARSGLPHVAREIIIGIFQSPARGALRNYQNACEYSASRMSCYTPANVVKRFLRLLQSGATFPFSQD